MKWNGRYYRPGYGVNVYPKPEDSIKELLKPLGEKTRKGNVWIPVLNQPINVLKDDTTPVPPVSPSPTPTQTGTPTPTPTPSSTVPEPSPSPTPTGTPTPSPSQQVIDYSYRESRIDTGNKTTYDFTSVDFGGAGLIVISTGAGTNVAGAGITSVVVDGVTATLASGGGFDTNKWFNGIYYAVVTGTTGTVSITTALQSTTMIIGVWRITGYSSTTPFYASGVVSTSATLSRTTTSLPSRSVGIASVTDQSTNLNQSWTNATERYELNNADVNYRTEMSGADFLQTTTGTRTVSVTGLSQLGCRLDVVVWS